MLKDKGLLIHPDELTDYWVDMFIDSELGTIGIHPQGGVHGGAVVKKAIEFMQQAQTRRLIDKLESNGVVVEYEMHAVSYLLPRELFDKNPSLFRVDEHGQRTPDCNACSSSQEGLEIICENAARLANIFTPTNKRFHFWVDDIFGKGCHCEQCRQRSVSDNALIIYNAILTGLKSVYSDAAQSYLAYQDTLDAPSIIKPQKGIFLEYAPMQRDFTKPLNDVSNEKNSGQIASIDSLLSLFGKKNSKALDYWLDNSYHSNWKKPPKRFVPDLDVAAKDIRFYLDKGFEAITCFACFLGEDYYELYKSKPAVNEYAELFK